MVDRISVYPCFEALDITSVSRLGRPPLRHPRFVTDVNLGKLTRYLRLLGLDCQYNNSLDDEELAAISKAEHRILLTRDQGLLKRGMVDHGIYIHASDADEQVHEVAHRIDLGSHVAPFRRCMKCNGLLRAVEKDAVVERVPGETWRAIDTFYQCDDCAKVYWRGAHWQRLRAIVNSIVSGLNIQ